MKRDMAVALLAAGAAVMMTGCSLPQTEGKTESSVQESTGETVPSETPTPTSPVTPEPSSVESSEESSEESDVGGSESSEASDTVEPQIQENPSPGYEAQLQVLADNHDKWHMSALDIPYGWCAVTDLIITDGWK